MVELEDLRHFREHPPLAPTPREQLERRVEQRRRRRWGATAVIVAAVLVAAGIALATNGRDDELRTIDQQSVDARNLLLDLAARSEQHGWPTTADMPILYETREGTGLTTVVSIDDPGQPAAGHFETSNRMERWWLTKTRKREIGKALTAPRPLDGIARQSAEGRPPMDEFFFRGLLVEEDYVLPNAPVDGMAGERTRVSRTFPDERSEGRLFEGLSEQLQIAHADGTLRAGWLRLLADVNGLVVVPNASDRLGRVGVGVVFTTHEHDDVEHLLIFDPTTGALLGARIQSVANEKGEPMAPPFVESDLAFTVQAVAEAPAPHFTN
jgi:hypothetical protein